MVHRVRNGVMGVVIGITFSAAAQGASISGSVQLTDSKDAAVLRQKDNSGVVVWLDPVAGKADGKPAGSIAITHSIAIAHSITVAHKGKKFVPHVAAVQTGTRVSFPNQDAVFHNAFSNYEGQVFDIGLHPPGTSREVTLRRPGIVRLFCNIHPTMSAVIVVVDTPYFAVSNAKGEYTIAGAPPGQYRMKVFHERALPAQLKALERELTVGPEDLVLPPVTLSEAGYLAPPHKDKSGKDYPAVIKDQYPGRQ